MAWFVPRMLGLGPVSFLLLTVLVMAVAAVLQGFRRYDFEGATHHSRERKPCDDKARKQRMTPAKLDEVSQMDWDAIVIGSGMGKLLSSLNKMMIC